MIIKGGSRAAPNQLAKHLQRTDTNETVKIIEVQWGRTDLESALNDWQTLSEGTRGKKGLYHVNIDPAMHYTMTEAQWNRCVEVLEQELGFEGLPRAVVMHEKHGRQHIHVVWGRTDVETMTLRSDSMNYLAHERASKALELEFGHELVPGKHSKRDREKQKDFPRAEYDHAEWQQAERTGIDPAERKELITQLKQQSDSAQAFRAALEENGYILAKGEKVPFVVVDAFGEIYNLSRQIDGMKTAQLRAFINDIDLPSAAQAVEIQRERLAERQPAAERQPEASTPQEPPTNQTESPELEAIKQAALERQAKEAALIHEQQNREYQHKQRELDDDIASRLRSRDADDQAQRAEFEDKNKPKGFDRVVEAVQRVFNPELARARDAEREQKLREFQDRQRQEREDYAKSLRQLRDLELENLRARHDQALADHATRGAEEFERYVTEHAETVRLREQLEEQERQAERERDQMRDRNDGPERPPPNLTR